MKIVEIDFTDVGMTKIKATFRGGECPICKVELITLEDLKYHLENSLCKKALGNMIVKNIKGDKDGS